jgi:hypothetical protein
MTAHPLSPMVSNSLMIVKNKGSQTVGVDPGGRCWPSGWRLDCMRDIFILNVIWVRGQILFIGTLIYK